MKETESGFVEMTFTVPYHHAHDLAILAGLLEYEPICADEFLDNILFWFDCYSDSTDGPPLALFDRVEQYITQNRAYYEKKRKERKDG